MTLDASSQNITTVNYTLYYYYYCILYITTFKLLLYIIHCIIYIITELIQELCDTLGLMSVCLANI